MERRSILPEELELTEAQRLELLRAPQPNWPQPRDCLAQRLFAVNRDSLYEYQFDMARRRAVDEGVLHRGYAEVPPLYRRMVGRRLYAQFTVRITEPLGS